MLRKDEEPKEHLEENLVAVQVLGLPAGGADGAAGVGQQRDQLAHLLHVELQEGGAAGLHGHPRREPLEGQLQTHARLCNSQPQVRVRLTHAEFQPLRPVEPVRTQRLPV